MKSKDGDDIKNKAYEELHAEFIKKMKMIPQDCLPAVGYWFAFSKIQKSRIALTNQLFQVNGAKEGKKVFWTDILPADVLEGMTSYYSITIGAKKAIYDELKKQLKESDTDFDMPDIYKPLTSVEDSLARKIDKHLRESKWFNEVLTPALDGSGGVGGILAVPLLISIADAKRFPSFGRLVSYAGLDVTPEGKAPKRQKGKAFHKNALLRKTLFLITESWNKMPECKWRIMWDEYKKWYTENRPEILLEKNSEGKPCGKGHIMNMARRKVQREFLRNLYHQWYEWEG